MGAIMKPFKFIEARHWQPLARQGAAPPCRWLRVVVGGSARDTKVRPFGFPLAPANKVRGSNKWPARLFVSRRRLIYHPAGS